MFVRVSCFFTSVRYYPTESNIIHILNENKVPYQHYTEADLGRDNGDGLQNSYTDLYDVSTSCSGVDEIATKGLDAFALLVEAWDVDPRKDLEVCGCAIDSSKRICLPVSRQRKSEKKRNIKDIASRQ